MIVAVPRRPRVLLSSVFKPFAVDDRFGSRAINPAELYHNQVERICELTEPRSQTLRTGLVRTWFVLDQSTALWSIQRLPDFPRKCFRSKRFGHERDPRI